ncbi:hypothetical protein CPC08DRAFT_675027 [Agrocybe pediades]|nr:hypothetical protein CPC08DRAFT_675027 [Agrocybe pediades]
MPQMISGNNITIHDGQFTQVNNPSNRSSPSLERLINAAAPNALHNSKARFDAPKCYPNTRVAVLNHIMNWAHGQSRKTSNKTFMWLRGSAGCGKSTIAQTTIESCLEKGVKLAAFFFNRFDPSRNHSRHLIATLAYQVYTAFPETGVQRLMLSAIEDDPLIFDRTIRDQFHALIAHPLQVYLSSLHSERPSPPGLLIVIDGLDECVDRTSQQEILEALSDSEYAKTIPPIQILIASRPEPEIMSSFDSMNMKDTHTRLALDSDYRARADIELYLRDSFEKIKLNHPFGRYLGSSWPENKHLVTLLNKSSGQFIYAASVVKYVGSIRHRPDHRLEAALHLRPHNGDLPFAQLDSLYTMILQSALDVEKVFRILSFHLIAKSRFGVPCSTIERILSYDEGEVDILFCDLQAVIEIRRAEHSEDRYLAVVHASFEDYLLDPERSKQFHVDIEQERTKHLVSILQHLSSYRPLSMNGYISIFYCINHFLPLCIISCELKQALFSFRMQHFMQYWAPRIDAALFVRHFFSFLKRLTLENSSDSYIGKHQLNSFNSSLFQYLERFYADDGLALSLMLILFHLGSHRYIPMIIQPDNLRALSTYTVCSCPTNLVSLRVNGKVQLYCARAEDYILKILYHLNWCEEPSEFRDHLRTFLLDPERSGEYIIGPDTYAKAALGCFKKIRSLGHPEAHVWHDMLPELDEDDYFETWRFDSGHWKFNISTQDYGYFDEPDLYFIVLGYLIFFLPQCGRWDALIAECLRSKESFPVPWGRDGKDCFPIRRWHLYREIEAYLARFNSA